MGEAIDRIADTPHQILSRVACWVNKHRESVKAWVILIPILIYHIVFFLIPLAGGLYISFTDWRGMGAPQWVGLRNFVTYLSAPYRLVWFNTLIIAIPILLLSTSISFFIALLLNEKVIGQTAFRALWYLPGLTSGAITASAMLCFLGSYDGVLNLLLKAAGQAPVIWLWEGNWMRFFIILYSVWRGVGGPVVLFLAALQGIHRELYEAARVDGASGLSLTRHITVPMMRPMITFVLITGLVGTFQVFDAIKVLTGGGPDNMTAVIMIQIYNDAFGNARLGLGAAGSVTLALAVLGLSIAQMRMMSRAGDVEAE